MSDIEPEIIYRAVYDDFDRRRVIGVISFVNREYCGGRYNNEHRHWITMPNGMIRHKYRYKNLTECEYGEYDAFEIAPVLKVSFRPVSRVLCDHHEYSAATFFITLGLLLANGLILMIAHIPFGADIHSWLDSTVYGWAVRLTMGACLASGILSLLCWWGSDRYSRNTKDDRFVEETIDTINLSAIAVWRSITGH